MGLLYQALSKIPYSVSRGEMNATTWNALKGKVMAVHGPSIDWWGVRIAVNKILISIPGSPEKAFNIAYEFKPLPYRNNNPDGSPTIKAILEYAAAFIVLLVIVFAVYAFFLFGIMLVTALILGGVAAVVRFLHR